MSGTSIGLDDTCWWYSLCNFPYRQHYEHTGSDHFDGWIYTSMYCYILIWCGNTRTSMIKTNVLFRFYWFSGTSMHCLPPWLPPSVIVHRLVVPPINCTTTSTTTKPTPRTITNWQTPASTAFRCWKHLPSLCHSHNHNRNRLGTVTRPYGKRIKVSILLRSVEWIHWERVITQPQWMMRAMQQYCSPFFVSFKVLFIDWCSLFSLFTFWPFDLFPLFSPCFSPCFSKVHGFDAVV